MKTGETLTTAITINLDEGDLISNYTQIIALTYVDNGERPKILTGHALDINDSNLSETINWIALDPLVGNIATIEFTEETTENIISMLNLKKDIKVEVILRNAQITIKTEGDIVIKPLVRSISEGLI